MYTSSLCHPVGMQVTGNVELRLKHVPVVIKALFRNRPRDLTNYMYLLNFPRNEFAFSWNHDTNVHLLLEYY